LPANTIPITPLTPIVGIASSIATLTARTTIVGTTGLTALTATTTNGLRVDKLEIQLTVSSAAAIIFIWLYDGTNSTLFDEIPVAAVTASNTVPAFHTFKPYANLVLPSTYRLYCSTTINQNTNVFAYGGAY
jgi:hypothetical protein